MDTLNPPMSDQVAPTATPVDVEKRTELTLDALKRALAEPGAHRLFRSGKLPGLFPTRIGISSDAALRALTDGLLETVRTETKGKFIVEWVRVTPKGVAFVHDRDSPKAVLRELRDVIGETRSGVPAWMEGARHEVAAVAERFERQGNEMLKRLDALAERVEAALRRAEAAGFRVPDPVAKSVPWAETALDYLDRRSGTTSHECSLAELFHALRDRHSELTVPEFHQGVQRLADVRAVRLVNGAEAADPEYALIAGAAMFTHVTR